MYRVICGSTITVYKCKILETTQLTISRDLLTKLEYIHTITESKLTLLAARLVNEHEMRCWDQEGTLFGSQLTMKTEG